jgi:hypothetical protein
MKSVPEQPYFHCRKRALLQKYILETLSSLMPHLEILQSPDSPSVNTFKNDEQDLQVGTISPNPWNSSEQTCPELSLNDSCNSGRIGATACLLDYPVICYSKG